MRQKPPPKKEMLKAAEPHNGTGAVGPQRAGLGEVAEGLRLTPKAPPLGSRLAPPHGPPPGPCRDPQTREGQENPWHLPSFPCGGKEQLLSGMGQAKSKFGGDKPR